MAVELFLGPVVEAIVSKVIDAASEQVSLARGWKQDLSKFSDTMKILQGVLQDADEKRAQGVTALKAWLEQLRAVAEDADDMFQELAYENMRRRVDGLQKPRRKKVRCYFTLSNSNPLVFRLKMANRVKNLSSALDEINNQAIKFGLQVKLAAHTTAPKPRVSQTQSCPSYVIGREKDVSVVISMLTDPSSDQEVLSVISIVGMGGLGKTTLAQKVCKSDKICGYFDKIVWICVSETFEVENILKEMWESLSTSTSCTLTNRNTLVREIKEKLSGGSYLLILDDVWNEDSGKWDELRDCLLAVVSTKLGNRVVVTTRNQNVARIMGTRHEQLHNLRGLEDDECLCIIMKRAFGDHCSIPSGLIEIGRGIAEKCGGLPLVASVIGGTLCNNVDRNVWESVRNQIDARGSLGGDRDRRIMDILKLSFHRLPNPALKQCFAFCSVFPKDFVVEKEWLVQLWMAEGFLRPSGESTMEDVGEEYFNDLLAYSLFHEEKGLWGRVCFKMHDLVHDLASSITKGETVIYDIRSQDRVSDQVKYLNLIDGVPANLENVAEKLHTLFLMGRSSSKLSANIRKLRAFSFRGTYTTDFPLCLSKLKSLAFLDVSETLINELPEFIGKLYNLQTLRYMYCYQLNGPPKGIENLLNLRHIYFDRKELMPANLGRLSNLQTLPLFAVGKERGFRIEELGGLKQLKGRLAITNLGQVRDKSEAEGARLQDKKDIEELQLKFDSESEESDRNDYDVLEGLRPPSTLRILSIEGYRGSNLPSWVSELEKLVELNIERCEKLIGIPRMEGFSTLKRVVIKNCEEISRIDDGFWSNTLLVEYLEINGCPKLENLSLPKRLKTLYLSNCDSLRFISSLSGVSSCNTLEILKIKECKNLSCIPSLDGCTSLKKVYIKECDQLECLPAGLSSCSALEQVEVWSCKNLVFCPKELEVLPSLVHLVIVGCPNLRSNPTSPVGEESLISFDHLKRLQIYSEGVDAFFSSIQYLPSIEKLELCTRLNMAHDALPPLPQYIQCGTALKELRIVGFQVESSQQHFLGKLVSLTKLQIRECDLISIPEELKELPSLVELEFYNCKELRSFPAGERGFSCLTSLRRLTLGPFSPDLEEFPDLSSFPPTPNLEYLRLYGWDKLTQLPHHLIQHLGEGASSLKELEILTFNSLEALPEWLGNLSSIQTLMILWCKNLKHFPSAEASKLHRLQIGCCPMLKESCAKGSGSEWSKISHIPNIIIDGRQIKPEN